MSVVTYEVNEGIAHIQLNRPEKLNTFSYELTRQLSDALDRVANDAAAKVVVLSGNGSSFCAGGDLDMMKDLQSSVESYDWLAEVTQLTLKIRSLPKYVVAAIHGYAAGAGFSLALASDFIIAEKDAKFTLSFSKVGLIPDLGSTQLLLERVPINLVKEWISFGSVLNAETLLDKGVVNRVVQHSVVSEAMQFSKPLVNGSPLSQKFTKKIINELVESKLRDSIALENLHQAMLLMSSDHKEGIAAFFQKRKPVFKGN